MEDKIDERNRREECARSIIKGYNVHYITKAEAIENEARSNGQQMQPKGNMEKEVVGE